jgi:hypothetical protein
MEQIYYTQCPIGYGLGASNGFQVKRITPGYTLSGDFRHLGLRAFPAGGRTLAPPALRYRRVNDTAEVAWLTPRSQEYETERGLWGRPGGHFAHGLILTSDELRSLGGWTAGLYDSPIWRRSDPEPSRGRLPDPIDLRDPGWIAVPGLNSVIGLSRGLDSGLLARLLTAMIAVVREGRTLFLIDERDRLGPRIAFLTILFPAPIREELTFSTYHDRPEELPGYRIHGTIPGARPNRGLLLNQGVVADLIAGTVDPHVQPRAWAIEMARWVEQRLSSDWIDFARRMVTAAGSPEFAPWDDDWLDRLVAFGRAIKQDAARVGWDQEADLASWAAATNLANEWVAARGPQWWLSAEANDEGRHALSILAGLRAIWSNGSEGAWGRAVAHWFGSASPEICEAVVLAFTKGAPNNASRNAFVHTLRRTLPKEAWVGVRRSLDAAFASEPRMVALWSVPEAVAAAAVGQPGALRDLLDRLERLGEPIPSVLEAVRLQAEDRPERIAILAEVMTESFARPGAFRWALAQGDGAIHWLRPYLRRRLALPDGPEAWRMWIELPGELRPVLARSILIVADDPGLPDEAFVWGVEEVLMPIPEVSRPADAAWAGRYLDRSGSDLALIARLFSRGSRSPGLRAWLDAARGRDELTLEHLDRLVHLKRLARALDTPDPSSIETVDLARVPGRDRGPLLGRLLRRDALGSADSGATLERCGESWPDSLQRGSADLPEIARAIAESDLLRSMEEDAESWFARLANIVSRLCPSVQTDETSGPDGLIARVVAWRNHAGPPNRATWKLRSHLLASPAGWKALAEDFRLDLLEEKPEASGAIAERWDHNITAIQRDRFWEVILNVCDGRRLAAIIPSRVSDLVTLKPLHWWDHRHHSGASDDIRDAFARLVPIGPLNMAPFAEDEKTLDSLIRWMGSETPNLSLNHGGALRVDLDQTTVRLSDLGRARWNCIERLTMDAFRRGIDEKARCFNIQGWCVKVREFSSDPGGKPLYRLPLAQIAVDDRYRVLAWVLFKLEDRTSIKLDAGSSVNLLYDDLWFARVAQWLVRCGVHDLTRISNWPSELAGLVEVPFDLVRDRAHLVRDLRHAMAIEINERQERAGAKISGDPDSSHGS